MSRWLRTDGGGFARCWWSGEDRGYMAYHDHEWGRPVTDERRLFEKLCLEGFQCGLSWLTILRKRARFREVFHDFDIERCAALSARDMNRLLRDEGIVRHRGKIESVRNNARRALEMGPGALARLLWSFAPPPAAAAPRTGAALPARTEASVRLSRELKRRGFSFVGPTTMYALMQAAGLVNDHLAGCGVRGAVEAEQRRVRRAIWKGWVEGDDAEGRRNPGRRLPPAPAP